MASGNFDYAVKMSKARVPTLLLSQKKNCENFLKSTKGIIKSTEHAKNDMIIEILKTVQFMVNHGFYQTQGELIEIAR